MCLAVSPGNFVDSQNAAAAASNTAHGIQPERRKIPQGMAAESIVEHHTAPHTFFPVVVRFFS